jgi:hypothetical protein
MPAPHSSTFGFRQQTIIASDPTKPPMYHLSRHSLAWARWQQKPLSRFLCCQGAHTTGLVGFGVVPKLGSSFHEKVEPPHDILGLAIYGRIVSEPRLEYIRRLIPEQLRQGKERDAIKHHQKRSP